MKNVKRDPRRNYGYYFHSMIQYVSPAQRSLYVSQGFFPIRMEMKGQKTVNKNSMILRF